jgi:hypothetical protein
MVRTYSVCDGVVEALNSRVVSLVLPVPVQVMSLKSAQPSPEMLGSSQSKLYSLTVRVALPVPSYLRELAEILAVIIFSTAFTT